MTIIALQTAIAYYNTAQVDEELLDTPNASVYNLGVPVDLTSAIDRLKRIKWENIAFIGFQVWFVGMSFDAASIFLFSSSSPFFAITELIVNIPSFFRP